MATLYLVEGRVKHQEWEVRDVVRRREVLGAGGGSWGQDGPKTTSTVVLRHISLGAYHVFSRGRVQGTGWEAGDAVRRLETPAWWWKPRAGAGRGRG